jgi:hypothetical protein
MNEDVASAIIRCDEAETFCCIEEFDRAAGHLNHLCSFDLAI